MSAQPGAAALAEGTMDNNGRNQNTNVNGSPSLPEPRPDHQTDGARRSGQAGQVGTEAAGTAPWLVRIHKAGKDAEAFALDRGRAYTLGRSSTADIQFDDDRVSRIHATLKFDGRWSVVDAMSSNGTHVCRADDHRRTLGTDEPLTAQQLHPGEPGVLSVGSAVLVGSRHQWLEILLQPPKTVSEEPGSKTRRSVAGRRFHDELLRASRHKASVFLLGPSGAGKTHAARFIHDHSGARGRFVAVNCAALPSDPTQLRSTLFGHVKGAFTSADKDMPGHIYEAHEGTIFLDEVDSLGTVAQGFLLDVIEQTGNLLPLGVAERDAPRPPEVRFVSASKSPLRQTRLRTDLTHRLADGDLIRVPSLSERREDIPGLVEAFLDELLRSNKLRARFSSAAISLIVQASWPGEIRQLRSVVDATLRACNDREGRGALLVIDEPDVRRRLEDVRDAFGEDDNEHHTRPNLRAWPHQSEHATLLNAPPVQAPASSRSSVNPRKLTANDVRAALSATNNNIEHAAEKLGIARRTLMKKMDELGVPRPAKRPSE